MMGKEYPLASVKPGQLVSPASLLVISSQISPLYWTYLILTEEGSQIR